MTPYYLFDDDAKDFHSHWKGVCDKHSDGSGSGSDLYRRMKEDCDRYFFIPARGEHRGIGGIFFDDLESMSTVAGAGAGTADLDKTMSFVTDVCKSFMPSYIPIVKRRCHLRYTKEQRHWQLLRRGRYIEFNMLYDRGVKFGLVPGGRIEAVMVSCPPLVAWDYNPKLIANSEEERLMKILKCPRQWVDG